MVTLKGTKEGLLITLGEGEWQAVLSDLASQLDRPQAAHFFNGARARLVSGDRALNAEELKELAGLLEKHSMELDLSPIEARPHPPRRKPETEPEPPAEAAEPDPWIEAALVRRTLRSGQVIRYPGSVIVYGDVNAGSEIVAGGDVIIWGRLRGVVHAGASGDDRAVVCALLLAPTQLRIGAQIARAPDERSKGTRGPEAAKVRDGRIVIEGWKTKE